MAKLSIKTKIKRHEKIVLAILQERIDYLKNVKEFYLVLDKKEKHYMLIYNGWVNEKYKHSVMLHLHIAETGKIWILLNDMDTPLVDELLKAGISSQEIVMGMYSPKMREVGEFAVE
jgi:hypothetical protein